MVIRETDVYDYARSPDKLLKSNQRRRVRDELGNASANVRERRIELAKAEAERLSHLWRTVLSVTSAARPSPSVCGDVSRSGGAANNLLPRRSWTRGGGTGKPGRLFHFR